MTMESTIFLRRAPLKTLNVGVESQMLSSLPEAWGCPTRNLLSYHAIPWLGANPRSVYVGQMK